MRLFLLPIKFSNTGSSCVGVFSSVYAVWLKSSNAFIGRFYPNNIQWLYTISYFVNHAWKLLPWTVNKDFVKFSIDAYHRCILPRYIWPFCFGNLNSRDYHCDSLNIMFSGFLNCFPWYFHMFLLVLLRFPSVFLPFPRSLSLVSYFRFCAYSPPSQHLFFMKLQ